MAMKSNEKCQDDVVKELYQLQVKSRVLETAIEGYLGNGRNVSFDLMSKYLNDYRDSAKYRINDFEKLRRNVAVIKSKTDKFKSLVKNVEPTDEFVRTVKILMEEIESSITDLKMQQKDSYEGLLRNEVSLWQECVFFEKKIDSWYAGEPDDTVDNPQKFSNKLTSKTSRIEDQNNPFLALQRFLDDTGGKTGGWSIIDHQTFIRIRQRYTGINKNVDRVLYPKDEEMFFKDLLSLLAPKTMSDIESHEIWYQKYQELLITKRKSIADWKEQKLKQESESKSADESDGDGKSTQISNKLDWETKKKDLEVKKQAVDAWRTQKAMEEYQKLLQKENAKKEEHQRKAKENEKLKKEVHQKIEIYRQKKDEDEAFKLKLELEKSDIDNEEKRRRLELSSARISERNTRMMEGKLIKKHQKQISDEYRKERIEKMQSKLAVTAPRDPSRLLKPTSGWVHRLIENEITTKDSNSVPLSGRIGTVQHKAVPAWRRDVF